MICAVRAAIAIKAQGPQRLLAETRHHLDTLRGFKID
jgi:hypothetical protein